jgi:SpoVK/Ycf46/Vps4 family AAA+-type ATPase
MHYKLSEEELNDIAEYIEGYSNADIMALVKEAALMPVRELPTEKLLAIKDMNEIREVGYDDLKKSTKIIPPSVSKHTV